MKKAVSLILKIAIPVVVVVTIILIRMNYMNRETLSLGQFVTICVEGADGKGVASTQLDEDALYRKLAGVEASAKEKAKYQKFVNSIKVVLSRENMLSNGDELTATISYDEKEARLAGVHTRIGNKKITVKDLIECESLDLFAGVKIITSGISPFITVCYVNESTHPYIKNLTYDIDQTTHLAIGDTIRITCEADAEAALAQGYELLSTYKDYTITTADRYALSVEDIPNDVMISLQNDDIGTIQSETADTTSHMTYKITKSQPFLYRDGNEEAINISYYGTLIASNVDTEFEHQTYIVPVYKAQVRTPNWNGSEDPYDYIDGFFAFLYHDGVVAADGTFVMATNDPQKRYVCDYNLEECTNEVKAAIGEDYTYQMYDVEE